jgi:hypothetical protein
MQAQIPQLSSTYVNPLGTDTSTASRSCSVSGTPRRTAAANLSRCCSPVEGGSTTAASCGPSQHIVPMLQLYERTMRQRYCTAVPTTT